MIAGLLAYLLIRRQRLAWVRAATLAAAGAFAFTMGMSRVYLGHHWLTDVLVAWTLGLAWLTVVIVAHRLFLTVSRRRLSNTGGPEDRDLSTGDPEPEAGRSTCAHSPWRSTLNREVAALH